MKASTWIDELVASGRYWFTTEEARAALGGSAVAVQAALRRLRKRGLLAVPVRGFHVILTPEHRARGCLLAEDLVVVLMEHLAVPWYAALLTAAAYHGAGDHPAAFQVMVARTRPAITCGQVRVEFFGRLNVADIPIEERRSRFGVLRVSTPEATAVDIAGYWKKLGSVARPELDLRSSRLYMVESLSPRVWSERAKEAIEIQRGRH